MSETKEQLTKRLEEIEAELRKPKDLARERDQIAAQLGALGVEMETRYYCIGAHVSENGAIATKTVVQRKNGSYIVLPHLLFERAEGLGRESSPISREEFKEAERDGRVYWGGRETPLPDKETFERLQAKGFAVRTKQVPPSKTSRTYRPANV